MTKSEINFIYQLQKYSPVGDIQKRIPRKAKKAYKLGIKKHFNRTRKIKQ